MDRKKGAHLSFEEKLWIGKAYLAGRLWRDIATFFCCCFSTILRVLISLGIDRNRRKFEHEV